MAGSRPATLVLGHTLSDRKELADAGIGIATEMRVVRWTETEAPITVDEDRGETVVTVECKTCGEPVVAHVLGIGVFRRRRRAWLISGLTIIVVQVTALALTLWASLDGSVGWPGGVAFFAVLLTCPVGFVVASVDAGKLTDIARRHRPKDGVHSFRIDPSKP